MSECKSVSTPIDQKARLLPQSEDEVPTDINYYQQQIGTLLYLVSCTRPDLAYVVSFLSQFSTRPLQCHHSAVKRVWRYLAGTRNRFYVTLVLHLIPLLCLCLILLF